VRTRLAGYKVPRQVVAVAALGRSPAAKVDYATARELVLGQVAVAPELRGLGA